MRSLFSRGAVLVSSLLVFAGQSVASASSPQSPLVLPAGFTPPQVFKNTNLLRTVDLSKPYSREVVAVIVENTSKQPQSEYYVPLDRYQAEHVSYVEARNKKVEGKFNVTRLDGDAKSQTQYYRIHFTKPLKSGEELTLQLAIGTTNILTAVPAEVEQTGKQYLQWTGKSYFVSAYPTIKQKSKIQLPSSDAPDYTKLSAKSDGSDDPTKAGSVITYGPYDNAKPGQTGEDVTVRFEYTAPVIKMTKLERAIEVSHWGGNLAFEEKYWMTNEGAKLKGNFDRVAWAGTAYYNPATHAIKQLTYDLGVGAMDPYFTDEIGNVSTSRFRSNLAEAHLELKPRFPVFGGWNYSFTVGWNHELGKFLRGDGENFVLKVPFLEGPKQPTAYDEVELLVILPEGASHVEYSAPVAIASEERFLHKTFMDTKGRTALRLKLANVVDELHHRELIVSYHLDRLEWLRKPFVFFTGLSTVFVFSWLLSQVNVKIGR